MRRVPTRTCLGCRQRRVKTDLVRLVRAAQGTVVVDTTGAAPGRGAYVCATADCVQRALKPGRLAHALRGACRPGVELGSAVLAHGRSPVVVSH